eukprot:Seg7272.1 transcript_id=Seg7272.1/GoldUCD/mRNA.D3Y31 product="Serine/threonine-protein kinase Nek6" protein_id=Seg7272.1/GoldUCD/D3Y31
MADGFDVHKLTDDKDTTQATLEDRCRAKVLEVTGIDQAEDLREKLDLPGPIIDFLTKRFGSSDFLINKHEVTAEDITAETYKATCVLNNQSVLLKCIPNSIMTEENREKEKIWKNKELKGIQRILLSFQEEKKEMYILGGGLCGLDDIVKSLKAKDTATDEVSLWFLLKETVQILIRLQAKDLRYDNLQLKKICLSKDGEILLFNPIRYITKNADNDPFAMSGSHSSAIYTPPELITGEEPSIKSDIWVIGCVLYEVAARKPAFVVKGTDVFGSLNEIVEGNKPEGLGSAFSKDLKEIIDSCLKVTMHERPKLETLLMKAGDKLKNTKPDLKNWLP